MIHKCKGYWVPINSDSPFSATPKELRFLLKDVKCWGDSSLPELPTRVVTYNEDCLFIDTELGVFDEVMEGFTGGYVVHTNGTTSFVGVLDVAKP